MRFGEYAGISKVYCAILENESISEQGEGEFESMEFGWSTMHYDQLDEEVERYLNEF